MSDKDIRDRLAAVFNSLNLMEVKGQNNVCNMAGCIQIVQDILGEFMSKECSKEEC